MVLLFSQKISEFSGLTIIPTLIGEGIEMFPDNPGESKWNLMNVEKFETGVVNLTYDRK